jgi:Uma2 family endonuclease
MSTIVKSAPPLAAEGRMTVDEFERFTEGRDERYELIDGQLIRKPEMKPPHIWVIERLKRRIGRMLSEELFIRDDKPVELPGSYLPRPDIAVVRGDEDTYETRYPGPADVALLIEVSISTLSDDQGKKRHAYALGGIPVYWIINAVDRQVEVYTEPSPDRYAICVIYKPGESISVVIDGVEVGRIAVDDILPRDPSGPSPSAGAPRPAAEGNGG